MIDPCKDCTIRKIDCHSNCPKSPSYDDYRKWLDNYNTKKLKYEESHYLESKSWSKLEVRRRYYGKSGQQ